MATLSIGLMEALLPYVEVERDRDRGTNLGKKSATSVKIILVGYFQLKF